MHIGEVRDSWICDGDTWTRPGDPQSEEYRWIELRVRPHDVGLHESGYRFLSLTGCWVKDDTVQRQDLHQWSDHIVFYGPVNIDVEPDGTIRVMSWGGKGGWMKNDEPYVSSALFHPADYDSSISMMNAMRDV